MDIEEGEMFKVLLNGEKIGYSLNPVLAAVVVNFLRESGQEIAWDISGQLGA